jgi:hypothetical protein
MILHVFIIYDNLTDISFSQSIYEKIIDKCEIYNSTRENIQKIFDKINTFPDEDFVWILYNNNSLTKELKLPNNVDAIVFNNYCNGLIIDNERLKDFPIKDLNISQFILKSRFLKKIKYSYKSELWINKYLLKSISSTEKIYLSNILNINTPNIDKAFILEDLNIEDNILFLEKILNTYPSLYEEDLSCLKDKFPFTLSVVVIFCDKDVKYLQNLYDNIKKNIIDIDYEIILMDNRELNKDNISFITNNSNVTYVNMGGNKRQFSARIESAKYINKLYTMYIDGDDEICNLSKATISSLYPLVDMILFSHESDITETKIYTPYNRVGKKYIKSKPTYNTMHDYEIITLWGRFIRSDIVKKSFSRINSQNKIIFGEDAIISYNLFYFTNTIQVTELCFYKNNSIRGVSFNKKIKSNDYLEVSTGFFETIKLLRPLLDNDNYKREFTFLINFLMERLGSVTDKDMSETFFKQIQFLLNNENIISIFIKEIMITKNKDLVKKILYYIYVK